MAKTATRTSKSETAAGAQKSVLNVAFSLGALPPHYENWSIVLANDQPAAKPDVAVNVRELTSLPAGEYDAVYCSQVLQTCYAHDVRKVIDGFKHVVKPDGFVEIRVPDVSAVMRVAVEKKLDVESELYRSKAGPVTVRDALYGYARRVHASPDHYAHRVGFSRASLRAVLGAAGFAAAALLRPRVLEIAVVAFPQQPTDEQKALLKLR